MASSNGYTLQTGMLRSGPTTMRDEEITIQNSGDQWNIAGPPRPNGTHRASSRAYQVAPAGGEGAAGSRCELRVLRGSRGRASISPAINQPTNLRRVSTPKSRRRRSSSRSISGLRASATIWFSLSLLLLAQTPPNCTAATLRFLACASYRRGHAIYGPRRPNWRRTRASRRRWLRKKFVVTNSARIWEGDLDRKGPHVIAHTR